MSDGQQDKKLIWKKHVKKEKKKRIIEVTKWTNEMKVTYTNMLSSINITSNMDMII